jgi:hypothetical protein
MLVIIAYSCFTTAYYFAFRMTTDPVLLYIEYITYICFGFDIIFNFFRIIVTKDGDEIRDHTKIAKNYFTSGRLIIDLLSTFPFFLLGDGGGGYAKMLRMVRLTRIMRIFNEKLFVNIGDYAFRKSSRIKRV